MPESLVGREQFTGQWDGRRDALTERGVELGLTLYNDALAVVDGGVQREASFPGLIEPTLALDLDRLVGWQNTGLFARGFLTYGDDPAVATGSLAAPSNIGSAVQTFTLYEAWLERSFADDRWSVRAGLYAVDTEFDVVETAGVFLNGAFGTGVDLSQSGVNGPCVYPTSCLGVRVGFLPTRHTYAQLAVLNGVAGDPDDPHGTHVLLDYDQYGLFTIGEVGYVVRAEEGRFFRAAVGAWHYSAAFDDLRAVDAEGKPKRRHAKPGLYAAIEGDLYHEPDQPTEGLQGFLRVGIADPDVHQIRYSVSAGLARPGWVPGRGEDVTAIGVTMPVNGDAYVDERRAAGSPVDDAEIAVELTHYARILPWLSLQLDAQYFVNPGTEPAVADALLLGLRCVVTL